MSGYHATCTGFRDADPDGLLDDDCVIFRITERKDGRPLCFVDDLRYLQIEALYFREHDYAGVVETRELKHPRGFKDPVLTPVADLPVSWPEPLRRFLVEHVAAVAARERGEA